MDAANAAVIGEHLSDAVRRKHRHEHLSTDLQSAAVLLRLARCRVAQKGDESVNQCINQIDIWIDCLISGLSGLQHKCSFFALILFASIRHYIGQIFYLSFNVYVLYGGCVECVVVMTRRVCCVGLFSTVIVDSIIGVTTVTIVIRLFRYQVVG